MIYILYVLEIRSKDQPLMPTPATLPNKAIASDEMNNSQQPPSKIHMEQDPEVTQDETTNQVKHMSEQYKSKANLKQQMDQLNQIHEKHRGEENGLSDQRDVEKEKLKEVNKITFNSKNIHSLVNYSFVKNAQ